MWDALADDQPGSQWANNTPQWVDVHHHQPRVISSWRQRTWEGFWSILSFVLWFVHIYCITNQHNHLLLHLYNHILLKLLPALNATGKKRAIQKKNNISLRHSIQSVLWEVGGKIGYNEYCSLPPGCSDVYCSPQFARWGKTRIPKCLTSSVLCQKNYLWSRFSRRNAASKNTPTIVQNVCHIKTSVNVSNVCLSCLFCQSAGANLKNDFLFCKTPGQFQPLVIRLSSGGGKQDVFVNMFEPYDV